MIRLKKLALTSILFSCYLNAHSLWINTYESYVDKPGHITTGLGWGDTFPIDDVFNSKHERLFISNFSITSPKGIISKLKIPNSKGTNPLVENKNYSIYDADFAFVKIDLTKNYEKGVYKISSSSRPTIYTKYIDKNNKIKMALKPINEINNLKKVLMSIKYQAFANSYISLGKWQEPKATNKNLEIIPLSDISNIKVGDIVRFKVLFNGKELNTSPQNMDFISARSNTFGQNDGYKLMSYIKNGYAQIKVQTPGQWIVTCNHKYDVHKNGDFKNLYGKVNQLFTASTLTFNVK